MYSLNNCVHCFTSRDIQNVSLIVTKSFVYSNKFGRIPLFTDNEITQKRLWNIDLWQPWLFGQRLIS